MSSRMWVGRVNIHPKNHFCIGAGGWRKDQNVRLIGDVNGDGRADIVGFGLYGVLVSMGQTNGTFGHVQTGIKEFGSADGK